MMNVFARSARRSLSWMAFGCLFFLALTLAACGSNAANSSNTASPSGNASSGSTAHDAKTSVMTISIKEGHDASRKDVYSFDPASITVKQGDTITIQNLSDELQDIDQGDAVKAGVDVVIPINQSGTMTFNVAGTFTIKSEKGATLTVTVQ
jgi:plastocyanin